MRREWTLRNMLMGIFKRQDERFQGALPGFGEYIARDAGHVLRNPLV
jgi:hypothetical protein